MRCGRILFGQYDIELRLPEFEMSTGVHGEPYRLNKLHKLPFVLKTVVWKKQVDTLHRIIRRHRRKKCRDGPLHPNGIFYEMVVGILFIDAEQEFRRTLPIVWVWTPVPQS